MNSHQPSLNLTSGLADPLPSRGQSLHPASEQLALPLTRDELAESSKYLTQFAPSRESLPPDVWAAAFVRKTREWDVPLISLARLGLTCDEDDFLESTDPKNFHALKSGAEACPYVDKEADSILIENC